MNPRVNQSGTLGLIATRNGTDRWIVSAYHVLCRMTDEPYADDEPIYQPSSARDQVPVARLRAGVADTALDCAAAEIAQGVDAIPAVFGIGLVGFPHDPLIDMPVVKAGLATGVTEGVIRTIDSVRVTITAPAGFPSSYDLSSIGDSWAVWLSRESHEPVALHTGGTDFGQEEARAVRITEVLRVLGLRSVVGRNP